MNGGERANVSKSADYSDILYIVVSSSIRTTFVGSVCNNLCYVCQSSKMNTVNSEMWELRGELIELQANEFL